jgi:iron-sulfur cluster assembly protein
MLLRVTEQAAEQIKVSIESGQMQGSALRVAAKRRADGTVEYAMGFDEVTENDTCSDQYGVRIAIAPTSLDLLSGAILDFDRPENESDPQFIFLNPNDPHFSPPDTTSAND